MADPRSVHKFLDTHTHIPNKVLITSRERAFKGDWPIEVSSMEREEATKLINNYARSLSCERIFDERTVERIYEFTDGHAYMMRVVVAESAREGRFIPLKQVTVKRQDIVSAIFERSFNRLSEAGQRIFLVVGSWRSVIAELPLLVVLGERGVDVDAGLEECTRLSLIERYELAGGDYGYYAPDLARTFAKKKLVGDPDRLEIEADVQALQRFGVVTKKTAKVCSQEELVSEFLGKCVRQVRKAEAEEKGRLERLATAIAELWPPGWIHVADIRQQLGANATTVGDALRRAVEEMPMSVAAWKRRGEHAKQTGDEGTYVSCMIGAAEADPSNPWTVREAAYALNNYLRVNKADIPMRRRGVYLASVRSHMERHADAYDATGLATLAWLFLNEDMPKKAEEYAAKGLEAEPRNEHCLRILHRVAGK